MARNMSLRNSCTYIHVHTRILMRGLTLLLLNKDIYICIYIHGQGHQLNVTYRLFMILWWIQTDTYINIM
jgi:hypothetical protein